jgi:saccharopine dehydrogenase (NAD+, L-lysine-forming)
MAQTYWLRGEDKKFEHRRALSPGDCQKLLSAGHNVVVEDWVGSIIPTRSYAEVGCQIVPKNSWINAPEDTIVVGLKYLPYYLSEYQHTHIYFAHAYKGQDDAPEILDKFRKGRGRLIDLEFMVDENQRRVCAFGFWAGYMGAALALIRGCAVDPEEAFKSMAGREFFASKDKLHQFIHQNCQNTERYKAIVIGAKGRSGRGAVELFQKFGIKTTQWDFAETRSGGPFPEILQYQLFVNCVLSMSKIPPFLTPEMLGPELKVISDVSCDPDSDCNVLPLYDRATTLKAPVHKLAGDIELIAIDNLPSLLPLESTEDFSAQLIPYLIDPFSEHNRAVQSALQKFKEFC